MCQHHFCFFKMCPTVCFTDACWRKSIHLQYKFHSQLPKKDPRTQDSTNSKVFVLEKGENRVENTEIKVIGMKWKVSGVFKRHRSKFLKGLYNVYLKHYKHGWPLCSTRFRALGHPSVYGSGPGPKGTEMDMETESFWTCNTWISSLGSVWFEDR